MLKQHPHQTVISPNTVIWRYMDLWKFEDLLKTSALYFTRADLLTSFDKREGSLTQRMQSFFDSIFTTKFVSDLKKQNAVSFGIKTNFVGRGSLSIRDELRKRSREHYQYLLNRTYINCWHLNDYENSLMWSSYITKKPGVAIKSTFGNLIESLSDFPNDIYAMPIDYVRHSDAPLNINSLPGGMPTILLDMLTKKHLPYKGESELRLISDVLHFDEKWAPNLVGSHLDVTKVNTKKELSIPIALDKLITSIFIDEIAVIKWCSWRKL